MDELEYTTIPKEQRTWKYTLKNKFATYTYVMPGKPIDYVVLGPDGVYKTMISLSSHGFIVLGSGYSWDGASGPAIDTEDIMGASAIHDALYQLMEKGLLDIKWKKDADRTLFELSVSAGMPWWRAWYVYLAVRLFGGKHLKNKNKTEKKNG
jgi:hypothetical protein